MVCIIHNNGIYIWYVYTIFYYRGGYKDIVIMIHKIHHYLLQFIGTHLTMSNTDSCIGYFSFNNSLQIVKRVYSVTLERVYSVILE